MQGEVPVAGWCGSEASPGSHMGPSLYRADIFPGDKTCTATGVTAESHWVVFIRKYPDIW